MKQRISVGDCPGNYLVTYLLIKIIVGQSKKFKGVSVSEFG